MLWTQTRVFVLAAVVTLLVIAVAGILYPNWAAERDAALFCDSIKVGTDIDSVILRFEAMSGRDESAQGAGKERVFHTGTATEHTFRFFGLMFDKASCDVMLDQSGKVTGKTTSMWYD